MTAERIFMMGMMVPLVGLLIVLGMLIVGITFLIGAVRIASTTHTSRGISTALGVCTVCVVAGVVALMFFRVDQQPEVAEVEGPWPSGTGTAPPDDWASPRPTASQPTRIPVEEELENRPRQFAADSGPAPHWMQDQPELVGSTYRVPIHSGPYTDHEMCDAALLAKARAELRNYMQQHFGKAYADLGDQGFVPDVFIAKLIQQRYVEDVRGQHEHHALLVFDRDIQQQVEGFYRQQLVGERLWQAGSGTAGVLGLLAAVWLGLVLLPAGRAGQAVATDAPTEQAV